MKYSLQVFLIGFSSFLPFTEEISYSFYQFGTVAVFCKFWYSWKINIFFSTPIKTHTMMHKVKKQKLYFSFTSYIILSFVFHNTHSRVSNNRTVSIICFLLKSSLYNAHPRPFDYQFYFLIPPARLFHSAQTFSLKLKRNTIQILCW